MPETLLSLDASDVGFENWVHPTAFAVSLLAGRKLPTEPVRALPGVIPPGVISIFPCLRRIGMSMGLRTAQTSFADESQTMAANVGGTEAFARHGVL